MKLLWRRFSCCIVFTLLLLFMVRSLDHSLRLVNEEYLCDQYYRYPENTFDVIFAGGSLSMYAIQPMQLFSDQGIAAYNLCSGNQSLGASYYLIRSAIRRDRPSLVVLDCSSAFMKTVPANTAELHYVSDSMPFFSPDRIRMIQETGNEDSRNSLFFPLIAYHARWEELTREDSRKQDKQFLYGSRTTGHSKECVPFDTPQYVENTITAASLSYLEKIVQLCRETGTELLLLSMPIPGENDYFGQSGYDVRWSMAQDITVFAEKNGIDRLNFTGQEDIPGLNLDPDKDIHDGEHLNRWGAEKFTRILGEYLSSHYDLPDHRGDDGIYAEIRQDSENFPLERFRITLHNASTLRHAANILAADVHDDAVKDVLVIMALADTINPDYLGEGSGEKLQAIGISQNLHDWRGHGYIAVFDDGDNTYQTASGSDHAQDSADPDETGDIIDKTEGISGKIRYQVESGTRDENTGEVKSGLSVRINGLEYAFPDGGLQIFAFRKSTGRLLDACRIDLNSRGLGCEHYEE